MMGMRIPLKWLFLAGGIEALPAIFFTASIPGDPTNIELLTFTAFRSVLLGIILTQAGIFFLIYRKLHTAPALQEKIHGRLDENRRVLLFLTGTIAIIFYVIIFIPSQEWGKYVYYHQRLLPWMIFLCVISLQFWACLAISYVESGVLERLRLAWRLHKMALIVSCMSLGLLVALIAITGLGIRPEKAGWYQAGVPILSWQIQLALLLSMLAAGLEYGRQKQLKAAKILIDTVLILLIWVSAAVIWNNVKFAPNYFYLYDQAQKAYYPFSDARRYAVLGQSLLLGQGLWPETDKPLYALFLAAVQAFTHADYMNTVAVQASILGFFPAVLYLLGKSLHSRPLGLLLAGMGIAQEANAIQLGQSLNLSHSKLLLTEVPSALVILLGTLTLFRWLKHPGTDKPQPIIVGALVGLGCLLRLNTYILIAAVPVIALPAYFTAHRSKQYGRDVLLFLFAAMITVVPWNYMTAQQLGYPYSVNKLLQSVQNRDVDGESLIAPPVRSVAERQLVVRPVHQMVGTPAPALSVLNHFMHNEIASFFTLPLEVTFQNGYAYVNHPLWSPKQDWAGELNGVEYLAVGINLLLLALGIGCAYRRWGWNGLSILFIHLAYNAANGIARTSGGRYIIPVEWGLYVYYALGLIEIILLLVTMLANIKPLSPRQPDTLEASAAPQAPYRMAAAFLLAILFGSALPLAVTVRSPRYVPLTANQVMEVYNSSAVTKPYLAKTNLIHFLEKQDNVAWSGMILYPQISDSLSSNPQGNLTHIDYRNLSFSFISTESKLVVLPVTDASSLKMISQEQEAIVVGCLKNYGGPAIEARMIILIKDHRADQILFPAGIFTSACRKLLDN
jgi:hypothetical protein